jgi:hypothetical protein
MTTTDVSGLLDMLCLSHLTATLRGGGYATVESLAVDDSWLKLIKKTQDRTVLLGYLSMRKAKDPLEVVASEKRMNSFQTVKAALQKLQDLQLKKVQLEQGSTVTSRSEAVRHQIENLLDEIDEAKAVLKTAQIDIEPRPRTAMPQRGAATKTQRPSSAQSKKMRSPRLVNEKIVAEEPPGDKFGVGLPALDTQSSTVASESRPASRDVGAGWNRNKPIGRRAFASQRLSGTLLRAEQRNQHVDSLDLVVRGIRSNNVALGVEMERDNYAQMCCGASRAGL